ncbi:MAG: endonuclease domain-containing protein [Micrococcaceae bacterium]
MTHRVSLPQEQILRHRGISFTSIERTWTDLAALPDLTVADLVVAGDFIVTGRVVPGRRRALPLTTIKSLSHTLDERGRFHGRARARQALDFVRVGSDSRPETLLRLALIGAGFPEPELQVTLGRDSSGNFSADMAYRELRIALQYDGAHHRTEEQQGRDALRDHWFQAHGWILLRVTVHDLRSGFARIIDALLPHFP